MSKDVTRQQKSDRQPPSKYMLCLNEGDCVHRLGIVRSVIKKTYFKFLPRVVKTKYGINLVKNFGDATFRYYFHGNYGFFYSRLLSSIQEDFIFLDIGSNQGLYTILAATNKKCVAVHSFEPVDVTFKLCIENVQLNKVNQKCNLWNVGIGAGELSISEISYNESHSGVSTMRHSEEKNDKKKKIITVGTDFLDLIDDFGSLPVHIKVDVEGLEERVISQILLAKFSKNIKSIFFEVDERWTDSVALHKLMRASGFKSFTKTNSHKDSRHYDVLAERDKSKNNPD